MEIQKHKNTENTKTRKTQKHKNTDIKKCFRVLRRSRVFLCFCERGFTLIELLLVIAMSTTIAALTIPVGMRFFQTQALDETADGVSETLRRAENQAMFQKNDSAFGVKFLSDSYILFQGDSYDLRIASEDENFSLSSGVSASGIDEVVFAKLTGAPSVTGTLTIASGNDTASININAQGKIERQ